MKSLRMVLPFSVVLVLGCNGESEFKGPPVGATQPKRTAAPAPAAPATTTASGSPAPAPITASAPATALGNEGLVAVRIPADGKYENVLVEGVSRPMINIMNGGDVVLVDTDGKKPRDWEEQYKRKGSLPKGYFDLHKTNANHNATFEDDPIDREGRFKMDEKGNLTSY